MKNVNQGIVREQERVTAELQQMSMDDPNWGRLYDAQQALMWAINPDAVRSPYAMIKGIQEGKEGCLGCPDRG